jgi:hypothetical protein
MPMDTLRTFDTGELLGGLSELSSVAEYVVVAFTVVGTVVTEEERAKVEVEGILVVEEKKSTTAMQSSGRGPEQPKFPQLLWHSSQNR